MVISVAEDSIFYGVRKVTFPDTGEQWMISEYMKETKDSYMHNFVATVRKGDHPLSMDEITEDSRYELIAELLYGLCGSSMDNVTVDLFGHVICREQDNQEEAKLKSQP